MRSSVNNREPQRPAGASTLVLGDGNWTYTWNDEIRLVAAHTPDGDGFYAYDGQPRTQSDQDGRIEQSERAQRPQEASTSGNVTTLVSTADGSIVASYDYSPFGLTVSQSGPAVQSNAHRFSTGGNRACWTPIPIQGGQCFRGWDIGGGTYHPYLQFVIPIWIHVKNICYVVYMQYF